MDTYHVGVNMGGIVGGNNNVINNFDSNQEEELTSLLSELRSAVERIEVSQENEKRAKDCIDVIENEVAQNVPEKSIIMKAFDGLKEISKDVNYLALIKKLAPAIAPFIK